MTVDVRHLRAFLTVVQEGTFTDAAIVLLKSQASVSRAVAELETHLGVRLLQRTSRGALPTVAGRRISEHAQRILDDVAAIERVAGHSALELRIGFAWSVFGKLTTQIHRRWLSEHPEATLTFVQSNAPTGGLLEGETDIAVLRRPLADDRFEQTLVGTEARLAAVAADDPLSTQGSLVLADLSQRTIAVSQSTGTTTTSLWSPEEAPVATRDVHGIEEWLTLVASGAAVGITSEATAEQFPRSEIAYRPVRDVPPIPVWLAWWRDDPPGAAADFRKLVCEAYARRESV